MNANKQDAGGLPNEMGFEQWYAMNAFDYPNNPIGCRDCSIARKAWHAALEAARDGELCRAAPAGGDSRPDADWYRRNIEREPDDIGAGVPSVASPKGWVMVPAEPTAEMLRAGAIVEPPDSQWGQNYIEKAGARQCWDLMLRAAPMDSAPAGGDVERFSPDCEPCSDFESWVGCMRPDPNGQWVRYAPAGSGEVTDEMVEAAYSAWQDAVRADRSMGNREAIRDALEAALLRKLQQGADYVMVPRVPTQEMLDAFCRLEPNEITEFHYYGGLTGYDHYTTEEGAKLAWETMIAASQGQEGGK